MWRRVGRGPQSTAGEACQALRNHASLERPRMSERGAAVHKPHAAPGCAVLGLCATAPKNRRCVVERLSSAGFHFVGTPRDGHEGSSLPGNARGGKAARPNIAPPPPRKADNSRKTLLTAADGPRTWRTPRPATARRAAVGEEGHQSMTFRREQRNQTRCPHDGAQLQRKRGPLSKHNTPCSPQ